MKNDILKQAAMGKRGELIEEKLRIIEKKISDEEAFEKFYKVCYLRNLRPATIDYYKNEFYVQRNF
jgi:hypothetical protein